MDKMDELNNEFATMAIQDKQQKQLAQLEARNWEQQPAAAAAGMHPNELLCQLLPVWQKLWAFECVPSPFKKPLEMQTIKDRLDQGQYKNAWEFCDHVWQMFENGLCKRKTAKIHIWCKMASQVFIEAINPVMRKMGYCCGEKLSFTPLVQFCFGTRTTKNNNVACVIARDQPYFLWESSPVESGTSRRQSYIYCIKCFEALPEDGINLSENSADPQNWIPKVKFHQMKNDQIDMEPFEECQICGKKWHRICAMHLSENNAEGFICEPCRMEKNRPKAENKFTAKNLPHCQLSRFIEQRLNAFLQQQKLVETDSAVDVAIRVVCSSDKEVEVKPGMMKNEERLAFTKSQNKTEINPKRNGFDSLISADLKSERNVNFIRYGPEGYPNRFPYRSKALLAFQVIKDSATGVSQEVCFFGLYVQEYGTNCSQPNQRRVYIAYLDSVHYFQPAQLRTSIFYEILLAYLQYAKKLGYTMAHIWACPPSEGDDYIFHCHPPGQRIPDANHLRKWYKKMLDIGMEEGTIHSYRDIFTQAKEDNFDTPMSLPYFQGDYWPRIIDECIMSAEKEEVSKKQQKEEQNTSIDISDDDGVFDEHTVLPMEKPKLCNGKKMIGKNIFKKKASQNKKKKPTKKRGSSSTANSSAIDKLLRHLKNQQNVHFTIRLFLLEEERNVIEEKRPEIEDPDPLISCELMDARDNFLAKSRERHWEFSQLRRAAWSTANFCAMLHAQMQTQDFEISEINKTKNLHQHDEMQPLAEQKTTGEINLEKSIQPNHQIGKANGIQNEEKLIERISCGQIKPNILCDHLISDKRLGNAKGNGWDRSSTQTKISPDGLNIYKSNEWLSIIYAKMAFNISGKCARMENFCGTIIYYFEVTKTLSSECDFEVGLSRGPAESEADPDGDGDDDPLPNSYAFPTCQDYCFLSGKDHDFAWPNEAIKPIRHGRGDVIGCGLLLCPENKLSIFFTLNGILMGKQMTINPTVDRLYPTLTIKDVSLRTNFGDDPAKPFLYKLGLAEVQKTTDLSAAESCQQKQSPAAENGQERQMMGRCVDDPQSVLSAPSDNRGQWTQKLIEELEKPHKQQFIRDADEHGCGLPKIEKQYDACTERFKILEEALRKTKEKAIKDRNKYQQNKIELKEAIRQRNLARTRGLLIAKPIRPGQHYGSKLNIVCPPNPTPCLNTLSK